MHGSTLYRGFVNFYGRRIAHNTLESVTTKNIHKVCRRYIGKENIPSPQLFNPRNLQQPLPKINIVANSGPLTDLVGNSPRVLTNIGTIVFDMSRLTMKEVQDRFDVNIDPDIATQQRNQDIKTGIIKLFMIQAQENNNFLVAFGNNFIDTPEGRQIKSALYDEDPTMSSTASLLKSGYMINRREGMDFVWLP